MSTQIITQKNTPSLGAVFTKPWTVEVVLDLAGYSSEKNLVDALAIEPSAGEGAFLSVMAERLIASCRILNRPLLDCIHSIQAFEINPESAHNARTKVLKKLVSLDVDRLIAQELVQSWIRVEDFLLHPTKTIQEEQIQYSLFEEEEQKADYVMGNPPYIRIEEISTEINARYRTTYSTMKGRADIYIGFYEAALKILKPNGVCAFICADRWMRNQYGSELRDLISKRYSINYILEMHQISAFNDEVASYPAITVIANAKQGSTVVGWIDTIAQLLTPLAIVKKLKDLMEDPLITRMTEDGLKAYKSHQWFKPRVPWAIIEPSKLELLQSLEQRFPVIEKTGVRIGIGVATGLDRVYLTNDTSIVESTRLLPLARTKDIASGTLTWSNTYLINPWNEKGLIQFEDYPRLAEYLNRHQADLMKRNVAKNNKQAWYRTIDRVDMALLKKHKLYIPDIKNSIHAVLDRGTTYPHHNLYFTSSIVWDLEVLGGILISNIGKFFVESYGVRMRGGYLRMQAQYLRRIRIPQVTTLTPVQILELKTAFRKRDVDQATQIALDIYGIRALPV